MLYCSFETPTRMFYYAYSMKTMYFTYCTWHGSTQLADKCLLNVKHVLAVMVLISSNWYSAEDAEHQLGTSENEAPAKKLSCKNKEPLWDAESEAPAVIQENARA